KRRSSDFHQKSARLQGIGDRDSLNLQRLVMSRDDRGATIVHLMPPNLLPSKRLTQRERRGDSQGQLVEALGIAVQQRGFVVVGNFIAFHQLADIVLAAFVGDFMRKVGGIEERLVAHYFDRERHGQLFRLYTDEATAIFDLFLDISARVFAFAYSELVRRNVLEVSLVGRVQTFKQQQQPGDPAFQEGDADPRETFEDAVVNDVRAVDRGAQGMAEGVDVDGD